MFRPCWAIIRLTKKEVLIKVHSFTIPMGSHGLHWFVCPFFESYLLVNKTDIRSNTIKRKMLCNINILVGIGRKINGQL